MRTIVRYFIHYMIVGGSLLAVIAGIGIYASLNFVVEVVVTAILMLILYSVGMAIILYNTSLQLIDIDINIQGDTSAYISKLEKYIYEVTKRANKVEQSNNAYVYIRKSTYLRWLTNPIRVEIQADKVRISIPKAYKKGVYNLR